MSSHFHNIASSMSFTILLTSILISKISASCKIFSTRPPSPPPAAAGFARPQGGRGRERQRAWGGSDRRERGGKEFCNFTLYYLYLLQVDGISPIPLWHFLCLFLRKLPLYLCLRVLIILGFHGYQDLFAINV